MSVEIINARSDPSPGGPPSYYHKVATYQRTAKCEAQQRAFFNGYIKVGTITGAAKIAGIDPTYHYKWLETDPDYPARFKVTHQTASESLVQEAIRRGREGVEEPTGWYKGEPGGFVRRYSDALLMFLIKGAFPDIYKDRHEHTGKNGGPIEVQSTITIEQFPTWLKQAIVVVSSGVMIDPEVERLLQSHFEAKFLEAEKVVGSGNVSSSQATHQPTYQVLPEESGADQSAMEMVIEAAAEASSENVWTPPAQPVEEPRSDWRPVKRERVTLDMEDI
jgi:hypothetical protein